MIRGIGIMGRGHCVARNDFSGLMIKTGVEMACRMARVTVVSALLAGLLAGTEARAGILSGMLLTNFASATFALPSGAAGGEVIQGVDCINVPNSGTAWVLVTDQPQLCLQLWKAVTDIRGAPLAANPVPGVDLVCFTISFSNCGAYSGFSVLLTDVMPANTVKSGVFILGGAWVDGNPSITPRWATSLGGPWYGTSNTGQVGVLYLRWLLGSIGMHRSGYIRYCVTVL